MGTSGRFSSALRTSHASAGSGAQKLLLFPALKHKTTMAESRLPGLPGGFESGELEALRPYLLRFALLQLRDAAAAEDAVQETLLAALRTGSRYAGRSTLKTWLTGILKHKIIDQVRRQSREQPLDRPD